MQRLTTTSKTFSNAKHVRKKTCNTINELLGRKKYSIDAVILRNFRTTDNNISSNIQEKFADYFANQTQSWMAPGNVNKNMDR